MFGFLTNPLNWIAGGVFALAGGLFVTVIFVVLIRRMRSVTVGQAPSMLGYEVELPGGWIGTVYGEQYSDGSCRIGLSNLSNPKTMDTRRVGMLIVGQRGSTLLLEAAPQRAQPGPFDAVLRIQEMREEIEALRRQVAASQRSEHPDAEAKGEAKERKLTAEDVLGIEPE